MSTRQTIAAIGECMVEFRQTGEAGFAAGFGGDTLNTAVYLARLGQSVDYVTALGDDPWSERMIASWREEGVGTDRVVRVKGATPGLYVIQLDAKGERNFSYWRDNAPARRLFALPETPALRDALLGYGTIYFSGISLSLYGEEGRRTLFETIRAARENGVRIAFDSNFRPRGWPDKAQARRAFEEAFSLSHILFASTEDLGLLFEGGDHALDRIAPDAERVVKHEDLSVVVSSASGGEWTVRGRPAERVVDTTAAGDSFAAAYLATRIEGGDEQAAAEAGHALAGQVVGYPGALIPRETHLAFG